MKTGIGLFVLLTALLFCAAAQAAIQRTTFTLSGDNGEVGSGEFTWEDTNPDPGESVTQNEMSTFVANLSGGNVVGGSTQWVLADCAAIGAVRVVNGFANNLFFECDNGTNSTDFPTTAFTMPLNGGVSTITVTVVGTSALVNTKPVPALSVVGLLGLIGLIGLIGYGVSRRSVVSR